MNAERLNKILLEIQKEYVESDLIIKLQAVRDNLQNQVNQPQQAAYQQNLVTALNDLYLTLENSKINEFSPGWKQIMKEIGGDNIFGISLKEEIKGIFATNQITPASALEDISKIVSGNEQFISTIDTMVLGFKNLNLGAEELEPGECELGYSIPRVFVKNKLSSLNKEMAELNFILNTISEAVTGEKNEYEVKTISSSDFLVYVLIGLQVGKVLSEAVEKIINNYKTILEIKVLRNQLKSTGVPEKATKDIEEHANSLMEKEIKKIATQIIKENYKKTDVPRKNELTNGVTIALNKIANRIDNGFNIEIRVEPLPASQDGEELDPENERNVALVNSIKATAKTMEFVNTSGQPILELNEKSDINKS